MATECTWMGKEDAKDGYGQFEVDGPLIHFNSFADFFYLQRLFDIRKSAHILAGKKEVAEAVRRYVEGMQ